MDALEERARHEGRVLRADLAVHGALERRGEQRRLAEAGQRVEIALLLLGRRGRLEALQELVVAERVARVGEDRDEGGQDVRVCLASGQMPRVELSRLRLDAAVVAEHAERPREVGAELARQLVLAGPWRPAERGEGRRQAVAHERREPRPIGRLGDAVEQAERRDQDRPHVAVALGLEPRRELEIVGEPHEAGEGHRPRVVHEVEALDRREAVESREEQLEEIVSVADPVEAVAAVVDDDRVEALGQGEPRLAPREEEPRHRVPAAREHAHLDGHLPALVALARGRCTGQGLGQIREALLAQHELAPLEAGADERIARREDPGVHHLGDRLAGRRAERRPEVTRVGVGVGVAAEIVADTVAEDVGAEELLEHPEDGRALLVGEHVEHRVGVARRPHRELDGTRRVQAVHREGGGAGDAERDPALPLGLPGVDGEDLHEGGEGLVEPDAVPPGHRDEVAEPHVRVLVRDHVGDALELGVGRRALVHQQRGLPKRDRAEVLHRARREVGDREEVELVARVRQAVILLEEAE